MVVVASSARSCKKVPSAVVKLAIKRAAATGEGIVTRELSVFFFLSFSWYISQLTARELTDLLP